MIIGKKRLPIGLELKRDSTEIKMAEKEWHYLSLMESAIGWDLTTIALAERDFLRPKIMGFINGKPPVGLSREEVWQYHQKWFKGDLDLLIWQTHSLTALIDAFLEEDKDSIHYAQMALKDKERFSIYFESRSGNLLGKSASTSEIFRNLSDHLDDYGKILWKSCRYFSFIEVVLNSYYSRFFEGILSGPPSRHWREKGIKTGWNQSHFIRMIDYEKVFFSRYWDYRIFGNPTSIQVSSWFKKMDVKPEISLDDFLDKGDNWIKDNLDQIIWLKLARGYSFQNPEKVISLVKDSKLKKKLLFNLDKL